MVPSNLPELQSSLFTPQYHLSSFDPSPHILFAVPYAHKPIRSRQTRHITRHIRGISKTFFPISTEMSPPNASRLLCKGQKHMLVCRLFGTASGTLQKIELLTLLGVNPRSRGRRVDASASTREAEASSRSHLARLLNRLFPVKVVNKMRLRIFDVLTGGTSLERPLPTNFTLVDHLTHDASHSLNAKTAWEKRMLQ